MLMLTHIPDFHFHVKSTSTKCLTEDFFISDENPFLVFFPFCFLNYCGRSVNDLKLFRFERKLAALILNLNRIKTHFLLQNEINNS